MNIKNETYDKLKWFSLRFLPAIATLIGTIGIALNWRYTEIAVVIITAVATALGEILKTSNKNYLEKHDIVIERKDIPPSDS